MRKILAATVALALLSVWMAIPTRAQVCTEFQEACIPIHPHGFGAGGNVSKGCLDWDQVAQCIYLDYNCNSIQELPNSDGVTECCIPCVASTTTTTTSTSTSSSSTSTTTTSTSSTTAPSATTSTSTSTTTSSSTSTTTTTLISESFAVGECFTLIGTRPEHDGLQPWIAPSLQVVTAIACHCEGECVSPIATIDVSKSSGGVISTTSPLVCSTGDAATTYVATDPVDTDRNLAEGDRLVIDVTNTPASYDRVTTCVRFD